MDSIEKRLRQIIREEIQPLVSELAALRDQMLVAEETQSKVEERWLKTREAAQRLGLAEATLANWRSIGTGPEYRRIGRAIRYDAAEIERYAVGPQS